MSERVVPSTLARLFGGLIVLTEITLITLLAIQAGRISVPLTAVGLIGAAGGALTAAGLIVGRVVFIPAAIVQLPILLFAGLIGAIGVLAGYIGGQSAVAVSSAIYAAITVLATIIITLGIFILALGTRRVSVAAAKVD